MRRLVFVLILALDAAVFIIAALGTWLGIDPAFRVILLLLSLSFTLRAFR